MTISNETPVYAVPETNLVPVSGYLKDMMAIPPSRMFLINKSLKVYVEKNPGAAVFDASQGDGGASLPGVPKPILERAAQLQIEHGTAYDMPFGTDAYRKVVVEKYWKLDSVSGLGTGQCARHCRRTRCAGQGLSGHAGARSWTRRGRHHRLARAVDLLQLGSVRRRGERALGAWRPSTRVGRIPRTGSATAWSLPPKADARSPG